MSQTANDVNQLFKDSQQEGLLSQASVKALTVPNVGVQINRALGIKVDDVQASEVVLVTTLIDDSGSIHSAGNEPAVRDGHNLIIDSLINSKQKNNILMHTKYLNGIVLFEYDYIDKATRLDSQNYTADGQTPLYDETVVILGTVLAKAKEFMDNGVNVRTITLIVTDGADYGSHRQTPATVASVVKDMLMKENHIIAAMGIDDHGHTDFKQIFQEMGLEDRWILTPLNSQSEIRKAFQVFSQSAVRASQSAQSFSQTALGGFGNP